MKIPINHPEINATNFVDSVFAQVKEYDNQPYYFLRIAHNYCVYEVLVNGILIEKHYSLGVLATPIKINLAIPKSGTQTVTYRLYPIGDLLKQEFEGNEEVVNTLINETDIRIKVVVTDRLKNHDYKFSDEELVASHKSSTKKGTTDFIGATLPYYEHSFTFEAKVPYKTKGWSDGQDLTKLDQKLLEQKILAYYNAYKELYRNKDVDAIARINFGDVRNIGISEYRNKKQIQDVWDEYKEDVNTDSKDFQPLKEYKIKFYGDGKIVALKHPSLEPVDGVLRGKSALWYKYSKNGVLMGNFPGVYLYLPQGQPLDSLQMME